MGALKKPDKRKPRKSPRARRGHGEGGVHQRADGRWEAKKSLGFDSEGKRVRVTVYGDTKQEALSALATKVGGGVSLAPNGELLFEQLVKDWVAVIEYSGRKKATTATYLSHLNAHASPLGKYKIGTISKAHVSGLYAGLLKNGVQMRTVQGLHTALRQLFFWALEQGYLARHPMEEMKRPGGSKQARVKKKRVKHWSAEEVRTFLAKAEGDAYEAFYHLALSSGLRRGELCGLPWRDVDLAARTITVSQALKEVKGKFDVEEPKTPQARRTIEIPASTVAVLKEYKRTRKLPTGPDDLVFTDHEGGYVRRSNFDRREFKPLIARAEVPVITLHDLRHTHATLLLAAGVPVKVVSERLGHASITITLETYAHVLPTMGAEAAAKFDALLTPRSSRVGEDED